MTDDMTQRMLDNARRVLWDAGAPLNPLNAPVLVSNI